ncbi:hypothetical protein OAU68_02355 [Litorivicinus sp.]|nr:hypothetical protein [Litorivicinus sp.]
MGPKVLTAEEISRYVDGELSDYERREIEFQAEAYSPSQKKLAEYKAAADQIASLFQDVIANDPAYRSFVRMVEDFEPRSIDTDIQLIRKLIPDRERLKLIVDELASDFYGAASDISMSMMSLERAPSWREEMDFSMDSERAVNPASVGMELARHLDEFAGVHGLFIRALPECVQTLRKLENSVMALRKVLPEEADPELAIATGYIEELVQQDLPGAKIMLKMVQGESVIKRDYQMAIVELSRLIERSR